MAALGHSWDINTNKTHCSRCTEYKSVLPTSLSFNISKWIECDKGGSVPSVTIDLTTEHIKEVFGCNHNHYINSLSASDVSTFKSIVSDYLGGSAYSLHFKLSPNTSMEITADLSTICRASVVSFDNKGSGNVYLSSSAWSPSYSATYWFYGNFYCKGGYSALFGDRNKYGKVYSY